MKWLSTTQWVYSRGLRLGLIVFLSIAMLLLAGTAMAAELANDETYHLERGETVSDDLVVFAKEIVIDGTVQGDLVAFGQFITVNGEVTEDVIAAGAEVQINGTVQDDVRAAGAAVRVNGRIGDDLFMAGGAFTPGMGALTIPMGGQSIVSGLYTGQTAAIGGDAYVAGGAATLQGAFRSNLFAAVAQLVFNAQVDGDAVLESDDLTFGEDASIAGKLTYRSPEESGDAEAGGGVAKEPEETASQRGQRNPILGFGWWLVRTLLIITGISLLGAVLLTLQRNLLIEPVDAITRQPVMSGLYGILAAVAAVPLSAAFVFLATIFFGWFWGAIATFAFCFGFLALAWVLSPTLTGLWLGRLVFSWFEWNGSDYYMLVTGASIIVLAGRLLGAIPCVGVLAHLLIYLASFALAAGGILISSMTSKVPSERGPVGLS